MEVAEKGLEIGKHFNDFPREKKQIPHATPIIFNSRLQGWLTGFADGYAEVLGLDENDSHTLRSAIYMFDGTSTGQRMGLDTLSERQRILITGPTLGYNAIYFEFIEKGKTEAKAYSKNADYPLLLYTLL
jgi:hypothetical protein